MKKGAILVLSGPSGAGKSTIIHASAKEIGDFYFSISTTTRQPREGEVDGVDYYFVSKEEFEEDIKAGHFLEYAMVHGNYYGTSLKPVRDALDMQKLVIFDIDIQGHRLVRAKMADITTSAFITPPSLHSLEKRLRDRSSDDESIILQRIANAKDEIKAVGEYDFTIINDKVEDAVREFIIVARASRLKQSREDEALFVDNWLANN